jgi:hypothetical protein
MLIDVLADPQSKLFTLIFVRIPTSITNKVTAFADADLRQKYYAGIKQKIV